MHRSVQLLSLDLAVTQEHLNRGVTDDLHDRFGVHVRVCKVRHSTVAQVMEDEVLDLLLLAELLHDAVGVRIDEIPVTPEKILKALGKEKRYGPTSFPAIEYRDPMFILPPWEGGDGRSVNQPEYTRKGG